MKTDAVTAMWRSKRRYGIVLTGVLLSLGLTAGTASGLLRGLTGNWAAALVAALAEKGIVSGDAQGQFHPDSPLTRAQLAKMFVTGLGFDEDAQLLSRYPSRFGDVPASHWGRGYIESLAETGITTGYPDGTFGPNEPVTRAQMATLLVRAADLATQAERLRLQPTTFSDDREIPSWARGEVALALEKGLVTGFTDGTFRPMQPVTRAESATVLLRLLNLRGGVYHLTGTLVRFDSGSRTGVVRDSLGQEHTVAMADTAQYYRNGVAITQYGVRVLDQVWIVLGEDGRGRFMESRFKDLLASQVQVSGNEAVLTLQDGALTIVQVEPYTAVFYNGRPAPLKDITGSGPVYVIFDSASGGARVIDAINAPVEGEFIGVRGGLNAPFVVLVDDQTKEYVLAPDARIFLDGRPVSLSQLAPGERVRMAVDTAGQVTYLQAER